jgi:Na+/H+-translocating membrane pyrophosphatase
VENYFVLMIVWVVSIVGVGILSWALFSAFVRSAAGGRLGLQRLRSYLIDTNRAWLFSLIAMVSIIVVISIAFNSAARDIPTAILSGACVGVVAGFSEAVAPTSSRKTISRRKRKAKKTTE